MFKEKKFVFDRDQFDVSFGNVVIQKISEDENLGLSHYVMNSKNTLIGGGVSMYSEDRYNIDYFYHGWNIGGHIGTYQFYTENDEFIMLDKGSDIGAHANFKRCIDISTNIRWGERKIYFKPKEYDGKVIEGSGTEKYSGKLDWTHTVCGQSFTIGLPAYKEEKHHEFWIHNKDFTPMFTKTSKSSNPLKNDTDSILREINSFNRSEDGKPAYKIILKLIAQTVPKNDKTDVQENV
jgi:hypothetical protein